MTAAGILGRFEILALHSAQPTSVEHVLCLKPAANTKSQAPYLGTVWNEVEKSWILSTSNIVNIPQAREDIVSAFSRTI